MLKELAKYGSLYETLHGTIGHEDLEIHLAASRIDNTWIRDKSLLLPLSVVLEWALHICSAMRYLHESTPPVIHRDLKSANVLLAAASASAHSHSGRIIPVSLKLCDFGTSREVDHANLQTFAGTLAWTAPEILRSDGQGYALSADVYSFGVVLWELVTRAIPFADVGPFDIARNVLENNRRPPIPAQTPTVLTNLLKQCWEQQPMRRPDFGSIYRTLDLIERRGIGSEQTLGTMTAEHFAMRLNRFAVKKYIEEANQEMLVAATTTQKVPSISAEDEGKRRQNELEKWAIELSHRENNLHNKLKNMQSAHDADMSIANKIRALAIAQGGGLSELQAAELAIEPFISKWSRAAGGGLAPLNLDTDTLRELSNPSSASLHTPEVDSAELIGDAYKRPSERLNDVLVRPKPKAVAKPPGKSTGTKRSEKGQTCFKFGEKKQVHGGGNPQTPRQVVDGEMGAACSSGDRQAGPKTVEDKTAPTIESADKDNPAHATNQKAPNDNDAWSLDVTDFPRLAGRSGVLVPSPPTIMFVGNTHRSTGDARLPHAWCVFVTDRPDAIGECASVASVQVQLHPTFKPSVITLDQHRKVSRERRSFMPFVVQFTIIFHPSVHLKHQRVTVKHTLCLADEGSIQVVEVPLKDTHEWVQRHSGSSYSRQGFSAETLNADLLPSNSAEGLITQPDNRQRRDSSEDEEWLYVDTSLQCRMIQKGPG